eukprot:PLAT12525.27.p1 GENE.PLAT12525.27~~PLAT12525.27.p1  ORF type:complete len:503 (+),score=215.52 PLAT12525.27:492-2000(+)
MCRLQDGRSCVVNGDGQSSDGAPWRRSLGITALVLQIVLVVVSIVLLAWRRDVYPLRGRSFKILSVFSLSTLLQAVTPLGEAFGKDSLPCAMFLIVETFVLSLPSGCVILRCVRIWKKHSVQQRLRTTRVDAIGTFSHQQIMKEVEDKRYQELLANIHWTSNRRLFSLLAVYCSPGLLYALIQLAAAPSQLIAGDGDCQLPEAFAIFQLALYALPFSLGMVAWTLWLRRVPLQFNLKKELQIIMLAVLLPNLMVLILSAAAPDFSDEVITPTYFYWLSLQVQLVVQVTAPALKTFTHSTIRTYGKRRMTRLAADGEMQAVELEDVLRKAELLDMFEEHLKSEFSVENLMFYNAVESFRVDSQLRPAESADNAAFVVKTYVTEDSPFWVNISARARNDILAAVDSGRCDVDVFHAAQAEIAALMAMDSLPRFLNSPAYLAYTSRAVEMRRSRKGDNVLTRMVDKVLSATERGSSTDSAPPLLSTGGRESPLLSASPMAHRTSL